MGSPPALAGKVCRWELYVGGAVRRPISLSGVRKVPERECQPVTLCTAYLVAVNYLGTNADGNDVYHVKFRHGDAAYVLKPPGPDGKVDRVWITGGGITPPWVVDVSPDRSHKIAMYRRPWH